MQMADIKELQVPTAPAADGTVAEAVVVPGTVEEEAHPAASPEVVHQLGVLTRQLHDTLKDLGVMPKLQNMTHNLPDARSRLSYIVEKTTAAAEKVLTCVEDAKVEHEQITALTRALAESLVKDPVKAVASGAVYNFVGDIEKRTKLIDERLTDIMMAQDFHDLTGQVVKKVVGLATELEDSLVKLLKSVVPPEQLHKPEDMTLTKALQGPVVDHQKAPDTVQDQNEVDDLLASMGF